MAVGSEDFMHIQQLYYAEREKNEALLEQLVSTENALVASCLEVTKLTNAVLPIVNASACSVAGAVTLEGKNVWISIEALTQILNEKKEDEDGR